VLFEPPLSQDRPPREVYTGARVTEQLAAWRSGAPLDELCDHLISSLAVEPQLDDVCVLAVSRPSPSAATR
jgi:hypothetical protein